MSGKCWCRWVYSWVRSYVLFPMMLPPPVASHDCPEATLAPTEESWMEWELIEGFRLWQLMFMALGCAIVVSVLLCCFMKCRIPRTKQEIEADYMRKKITKRFRRALNKIQIEEINLREALEKVTELCEKEAKRARRKKRKQQKSSSSLEKLENAESSENMDDDDESSTTSSEEKLTLMQRFKKLIGIGKSESIDEY